MAKTKTRFPIWLSGRIGSKKTLFIGSRTSGTHHICIVSPITLETLKFGGASMPLNVTRFIGKRDRSNKRRLVTEICLDDDTLSTLREALNDLYKQGKIE